MIKKSFFNKYLLPGFVFQSVIIGGGYGTGRELVEYFLKFGPLGGLLGMLLITTVVWSIFLALTFEFTRLFRTFDYRTFFQKLLGPLWPGFDVIYVFYLIIVLAVLGSASGILLRDNIANDKDYIKYKAIIYSAIGYRYQPKTKGLIVTASITPTLTINPDNLFFYPFVEIGLGYKF